MSYYSKIIDDSPCDNKTLFSTVNKLLHRSPERKLPTAPSSQILADKFVKFFKHKITTIREELSIRHNSGQSDFNDLDVPSLDCSFDSFVPVSDEELFKLCKKLLFKSCDLDPIPSSLLRQNLRLLLPIICKIVNLSLTSGSVPSTLKTAVLRTLLKKSSLDHEILKNYRPISNLKMVSKVIEKVVYHQLNTYLTGNDLYEPLQSAYRPHHSCETALLRVSNDILQSLDKRQCVAMLFLDLSAAFDTVDHSILLNRLRHKFGVCGNALKWFQSYLSNRCQFVSIDGVSSESLPLGCGVPQGSVLGPILYLLYTSPVADILRKHKMSFHFYADDTQIYIPFSCNDDSALDDAICKINACLREIDLWMTTNKLKLNKDKTEFLLFSSKHCPLRSSPVIQFGSEIIRPSSDVRNIGVNFDSSMSMLNHIKLTCKSSFYHLRNIAKIRRFLSVKSTEILIHSLISSKLDNCNSLLNGLLKFLIDCLQAVQNASARLITLSKNLNT